MLHFQWLALIDAQRLMRDREELTPVGRSESAAAEPRDVTLVRLAAEPHTPQRPKKKIHFPKPMRLWLILVTQESEENSSSVLTAFTSHCNFGINLMRRVITSLNRANATKTKK